MTSFRLIQIDHSVANMSCHSATLRYGPSPMDRQTIYVPSHSAVASHIMIMFIHLHLVVFFEKAVDVGYCILSLCVDEKLLGFIAF